MSCTPFLPQTLHVYDFYIVNSLYARFVALTQTQFCKFHLQIKELEKKCSNMKLLMSQKMEELEYSRKAIKSLEKDVTEMKVIKI